MLGLAILACFFVLAIFQGILSPQNPYALSSFNSAPRFSMPSWFSLFDKAITPTQTYGLLGSDYSGRDFLSVLIYGTRVSLLVGFLGAAISVLIGLVVGLFSGYRRGLSDAFLMRTTDLLIALPLIPLIIIIAAVLGSSIWVTILVIGLISWTWTARLVRAQVLSLRERTFVEAARAIGCSEKRIMFRYLLPNISSILFANATAAVANAILTEAGISFLGLGDPNFTSWGLVLFYALSYGAFTLGKWWVFVPPGLLISLLVLSFYLIGQSVDELLNPVVRRV